MLLLLVLLVLLNVITVAAFQLKLKTFVRTVKITVVVLPEKLPFTFAYLSFPSDHERQNSPQFEATINKKVWGGRLLKTEMRCQEAVSIWGKNTNSSISEVKQYEETMANEESQNGGVEYQINEITLKKKITVNGWESQTFNFEI